MSFSSLIVAAVSLTTMIVSGVASAQETVPTTPITDPASPYSTVSLSELCFSGDPRVVGCLGAQSFQITPNAGSESEGNIAQSPDSGITYVPYNQIVNHGGPNGEPCLTTGYYPLGVEDRREAFFYGSEPSSIDALYPVCPVEPGSEAAPDAPLTYVARYWQTVVLPRPEPYIAPGRAITGMFAYMETRGTTTKTFTDPNTSFGPLTIVATGTYYVDWGDGTHTGPHTREGGPWPDGQITHEYIHIGAYDVVVTERWTATWSFGSQSGTLTELRTAGRIEDFPVQQIQAVVLR